MRKTAASSRYSKIYRFNNAEKRIFDGKRKALGGCRKIFRGKPDFRRRIRKSFLRRGDRLRTCGRRKFFPDAFPQFYLSGGGFGRNRRAYNLRVFCVPMRQGFLFRKIRKQALSCLFCACLCGYGVFRYNIFYSAQRGVFRVCACDCGKKHFKGQTSK